MSLGAPRYYLRIIQDGGAEPIDVTDLVTSLSFEDHEKKADTLRLTVNNHDLAHFDNPLFAHGNTVEFAFGYSGVISPTRTAIIKKVTGGRVLTVEAKSNATVMDRFSRRRRFDNMTRSEVVREVAAEYGYKDAGANIEDTETRFETITQSGLTDAQFLRKLAHLERFEFFVDYDGLHWHRRDVGQRPIRKLIYYKDPGRGTILDFSVENDITRKAGRVRVKGRDSLEMEDVDVAADNDSETDRDVLQPEVGPRGVLDPKAMELRKIPGVEAETPAGPPQEVVAQEETHASNVESEAEAKSEARGRFIKLQQSAVKMKMLIIGDPGLVAKSVVEIEGMGERLSGKYYVRGARHALEAGYETELDLITDGYQGGGSGGKGKGGSGPCIQDITEAAMAFRDAFAHTMFDDLREKGRAVFNKVLQLLQTEGDTLNIFGLKEAAKDASLFVRIAQNPTRLVGRNVVQAASIAQLLSSGNNLKAVLLRCTNEALEAKLAKGNLNEKTTPEDMAALSEWYDDVAQDGAWAQTKERFAKERAAFDKARGASSGDPGLASFDIENMDLTPHQLSELEKRALDSAIDTGLLDADPALREYADKLNRGDK